MFRNVDDTLGVIYTHGIAGLLGGLLVGVLADPNIVEYIGIGGAENLPGVAGAIHGSWKLLRWQAETALFVIVFSGVATFILLKIVGIFVPLRLSDKELEIGDHAIHGNEVYPSDVPTLGGPHAPGWQRLSRLAARHSKARLGRATSVRAPTGRVSDRGPALAGSRPSSTPSARRQADRAGHARAAQAAVAAGVLGQVLLVVVLGVVEGIGCAALLDLGRDLTVAVGVEHALVASRARLSAGLTLALVLATGSASGTGCRRRCLGASPAWDRAPPKTASASARSSSRSSRTRRARPPA